MHGRPRQKAGPADPERTKAAQQKAALFGQLAGEVLARRAAGRNDPESLGLAAKLLELHPEVYTAWNYRREALALVLAGGGEAAVAAVAGELALTERALMKNPKSYAAWHHRRWVVAKGMCSLEHELRLVEKLLDADERNFHGWGYRRFIAELMGMPAERELAYAEKKINQNFSNYSAWHARTALLPARYAAEAAADALAAQVAAAGLGGGGGAEGAAQPAQQQRQAEQQQPAAGAGAAATAAVPKEALDEEYELVKQAFYTEPEDQSGWFYHRWLLGCSLAHWERARGAPGEAVERAALLAVLQREQGMCEELLEIEPEAKWPLLTLVRLKELRQQVLSSSSGGAASSAAGSGAAAAAPSATAAAAAGTAAAEGSSGSSSGLAAEVAEGYARLIELDPLRRGYYEDALAGRAHVVARPAAA